MSHFLPFFLKWPMFETKRNTRETHQHMSFLVLKDILMLHGIYTRCLLMDWCLTYVPFLDDFFPERILCHNFLKPVFCGFCIGVSVEIKNDFSNFTKTLTAAEIWKVYFVWCPIETCVFKYSCRDQCTRGDEQLLAWVAMPPPRQATRHGLSAWVHHPPCSSRSFSSCVALKSCICTRYYCTHKLAQEIILCRNVRKLCAIVSYSIILCINAKFSYTYEILILLATCV